MNKKIKKKKGKALIDVTCKLLEYAGFSGANQILIHKDHHVV